VKLGALLPTFRNGAADALAFADRAVEAGIDGLFAYDHLWPMGSPTRPSLAPFSVLAAVARRHEGVIVGPLVARIGLVGTPHLVEQYRTLERVAPSRVICALGSGDKLSAAENEAYDVPVRSADERRALMAETARQLSDTMPIWFGAGNDETNRVAREVGATINLWDASPQRLRDMSNAGAVSWAGPVPTELAGTLDAVCDAGATWAVLAPDVDVEALRQWRESNDD
jgi:alkanesulfonate monooxygenase SsuD/methylene tetrahydromethanopterin reductase-like flavin-dependent oxidoreductase (luciferase family)